MSAEQPKRQIGNYGYQVMQMVYSIFANALEVAIFALGAAVMICAVSAIL